MIKTKGPDHVELDCCMIPCLCIWSINFFSSSAYAIGTLRGHIDTGDAKPLKQPPRRVPMAYAEDEKKLIDQMQRQGIIQQSSSTWSGPLVLIMNKNGKIRPCIDY
jgi:hypothetical protein